MRIIFSFFFGSSFGFRVDDWVVRVCFFLGCIFDFGFFSDIGGGGLVRLFCGILGRDGVVEVEFLL